MGKGKRVRPSDDEPPNPKKAAGFGGGGGGGASEDRKSKLLAHVQALNTQFLTWVNTQSAMASGELWTSGVQDYINHAKSLREEFRDVLSPGSSASPPASSFGAGSFGAKPAPAPAPEPAPAKALAPAASGFGAFGAGASTGSPAGTSSPGDAAPTKTAFNFGAPAAGAGSAEKRASLDAAPKPSAFNFGAPTAAPAPSSSDKPSTGGAFAFGAKKDAAAAADPAPKPASGLGGGFTFGGASTGAIPSFGAGGGGFSFGAPAPKAADEGDDGDAEGEDGEEEKEARARRVRMEEEPDDPDNDNLFQAKAKYYAKDLKDGTWNEIGLGLVVVKRPKSGGGKPFLIFRKTEGGRVLLTTPTYKGMRLLPQANKPQWGVCKVFPMEVDHKTQETRLATEARTVLFKTGGEDKVTKLNEVLAGAE